MNLYVFNKKFELVEVIDTYTSVIWTNRYYTCGDFELYLPITQKTINALKKDYYVVRERQENNAMIINTIKITTDEENGNFLTVSGKCLKSILYQRIIWNQTNLKDTLEKCIEQLINENAIYAKDSKRNFKNLAIKSMIQTDIAFESQYCRENLGEVISSICEQYGIGWDIKLDLKEKRFYFELYSGTNRSYQQKENDWVIFSNKYENLLKTEYTYSKENYKNAAFVAGEGEGTEQKYVEIGIAEGIERYETFADAGEVSTNEGISEEEYKKQLEQKGKEILLENKEIESFEGEVIDYQFTFKKDYFLGDIVEVENEYGMQAVSRITEIIESIDESGIYTIPTFSIWEGLCIAEPDKKDDIITFIPPEKEKEPEPPKDPIIIDATYTGIEFNLAAKKIAGTVTGGMNPQFTSDKKIEKIEFTDISPEKENKAFETLTETEEGHCIKLYIDNGILKMYTDVDIIRLPKNMEYMFCHFEAAKEIDLSKFDTSNVINMQGMFQGCNNLLSIDVSNFDTGNIESMKNMFTYCFNLQKLDLSGFNTTNVTDMQEMFSECYELKELDISSFNTSNVKIMAMMFRQCKKLVNIDVSSFDTSNATSMGAMFALCEKLKNIDVSMFNNTSKLESTIQMFAHCYELESINMNNFVTSGVKDMESMFEECKALTSLDLRSFKTTKLKNARYMFMNCTKLNTIFVGDYWYIDSTTSKLDMFKNCSCKEVTYV